jgi:hypothetical protein
LADTSDRAVASPSHAYTPFHARSGVFYIGAGAASNNVILEVVEQGTDVVHTKYIVPKNTTWHDYRGGFNPNKYYYLRVGSKGWNTGSNMVVGSIEDRPL